jgi:hypothetical protein
MFDLPFEPLTLGGIIDQDVVTGSGGCRFAFQHQETNVLA